MQLYRFLQGDIQVSGSGVKIPIDGLVSKYREQYADDIVQQNLRNMVYNVNGRHFIHYKIPSVSLLRKRQNLFYDVVFEFVTLNEGDIGASEILLFSNSPGFAYNYAYAMHHYGSDGDNHGLFMFTRRNTPTNSQLVKELTIKYPAKMLTEPPKLRNPGELALADRTVYFALFHLFDNMTIPELLHGRNVSMNQVIASVASFEKLEMDRKRAENRVKEAKKREKKSIDDDFDTAEKDLSRQNGVKSPKKPRSAMSPRSSTVIKQMRSTARPKTTSRGGND